MKCNRCNTFNPEGFRFCASCGRALLYKPSKPLISPKSTTWITTPEPKKAKSGWFNWVLGGNKT